MGRYKKATRLGNSLIGYLLRFDFLGGCCSIYALLGRARGFIISLETQKAFCMVIPPSLDALTPLFNVCRASGAILYFICLPFARLYVFVYAYTCGALYVCVMYVCVTGETRFR